MAYTILRFKKDKGGAIAGCERHNERKKEAYKSNPDIDMNKSKENYHIIHAPQYTYSRKIKELIKEYGCKTRKDSVKLVETLITASPEFMNRLSKGKQREYFERAVKFMKDEIGEDRIISAVVHMDEATPHMHLVFCPINKDGKLSAKSILGNQKSLSEWQTRYYNYMHERWNELERGKSAQETKRKQIPTWLFKLADNLDNLYNQLLKKIENINMIGMKKNKDLDPNKLVVGSEKKAWWICQKCKGTWQTQICVRKKHGCPYCTGQKVRKGINDFATLYPDLLKEWDWDKNSESGFFPDEIMPGTKKKIFWKCKECGFMWQAAVKDRTKKNGRATGCPQCKRKKLSEYHLTPVVGINDLESCYPEIAKEWNYDKNINLLPSQVLKGSATVVWWKCYICGNEWQNAIALRTKGFGRCPICKKNK